MGYLSRVPEEKHVVPGLHVLPALLSPRNVLSHPRAPYLIKTMDILIRFDLTYLDFFVLAKLSFLFFS